MELSRRAQVFVLVLGLALSGCHTRVDGDYQLDLEQTKACVAKSAAENPEDGKEQDNAIKMLEAAQLTLRLAKDGQMLSTTVFTLQNPPTTSRASGKWTLEGQHVTLKVPGDADTVCDVDGNRLRCQKPTDYKLFGRYVLVRK